MGGRQELAARRPRQGLMKLLDLRGCKTPGSQHFVEQRLGRGLAQQLSDIDGTVDKQLIDDGTDGGIEHTLGLGQAACRARDIRGGSRIDGLQKGDDLQADFIAHNVGYEVGAVGDIRLTSSIKKTDNLSASDIQQRTDNVTITRTDACQPVDAGAADKVHQQRLDGIVLMVGHADVLGTNILPQLLEIAVAQLAGCHLDAHLMHIGVSRCVKMNSVERHVLPLAKTDHKLLVAVGLITTQSEVTMSSLNLIAQLLQDEQQGYAVGTTTDRHDVFLS